MKGGVGPCLGIGGPSEYWTCCTHWMATFDPGEEENPPAAMEVGMERGQCKNTLKKPEKPI